MSATKKAILALCVGTLLLSGCAKSPWSYPLISQPLSGPLSPSIQASAYHAADIMLQKLRADFRVGRESILPASFVDERNMELTTPFGRLLSRQFATRFTQAGHALVEIKLRKNILLQPGEGQFILTRELEKIRDTHQVHAVLTGSYVTSKSRVFITAQVVRLRDGVTLAGEDFDLPLTRDIRSLLLK